MNFDIEMFHWTNILCLCLLFVYELFQLVYSRSHLHYFYYINVFIKPMFRVYAYYSYVESFSRSYSRSYFYLFTS